MPSMLIRPVRIAWEAFRRFNQDDGWAIASHIALSALMALFPFLLVLTALAALFGAKELADESARIILDTWPAEVTSGITREVHTVLTTADGSVLTIGAVLALYFAAAGVESLRVALNRAYGVLDLRSWLVLRLESIAYVLVAAMGLLALSFLVFLAPLIWLTTLKYLPTLVPFTTVITVVRFGVASLVLILALVVVHLWLPAGRRTLRQIAPGIVTTLVLWLVAGTLFGRYLADFAFAYSTYYAGLASPMIALVFLYLTASIFIYGGELNNTLDQPERKRRMGFPDSDPGAPPV